MGTHPPHWRVPLAQGRRRLGCHSALSRNRPQLVDRNVRELPKGDRHPVKVLVALDEFASLGKCSVLANAFSYVAGYGLRLLPAFQSIEQIQGVYGDKVAADIERNCAVRRSEGRRGGKECVSTCRSRGSPSHNKQNSTKKNKRGTTRKET